MIQFTKEKIIARNAEDYVFNNTVTLWSSFIIVLISVNNE